MGQSDDIEKLLKLRTEMNVWSTFDRANLDFYETTFRRLDAVSKDILEIGSGYGFTSFFFALSGARRVSGLEFIPEAFHKSIELKDSLYPELPVYFQYGDASKELPFPDESFDCLTLIEVISHVICEDMHSFFTEMARVLRPGGLLFISDGNNGRSPRRRRINRTVWNRFENGPPTAEGETVDGHHVSISYVEVRRRAAQRTVNGLSSEEYNRIALGTSFYSEHEVECATLKYSQTGEFPQSFYNKNSCPVDPAQSIYMEKLFDPISLRRMLREIGFTVDLITTRRKLPIQSAWDAVPYFTMLLANGFVMLARKKPYAESAPR
jgi:SAM-dependent methyltransferase